MKTASTAASISLAAFGLFASNAAIAEYVAEETPTRSIEACVAEIGGHADYSDASRVLHKLETTGRRSLAHRLTFTTKVFGDGDELIREYATKCIVYGDDEPVYFEIEETDG